MIEANENIDLVTVRRQQEMRQAQESYRQAVSEGRLAVKEQSDGGTAALVADKGYGSGNAVATSATLPQVTTSATIPVEAPADPEAAWRHTRLAITAGLVLLLLVVWIWQKRAGR